MKLSRALIALYFGLVFASGAVLGAFGHRLYMVSTVTAKEARKNPEEFRKKLMEEYQHRLNLTPEQVSKLGSIMDETRARVEETRQKMRPDFDRIHQDQTQKIREMLTPAQLDEYEKIHREREQRQKQNGRPGPGPGF